MTATLEKPKLKPGEELIELPTGQTVVKKPNPWQMPKVSIGDPVYWYPDPNRSQPPVLAFVVKIHSNHILVHSTRENYRDFGRQEGVPHIDDPDVRARGVSPAGCWDYSDFMKRVMALEGNG